MDSPAKHPLKASNLQRAWKCPAAPWMETQIPDEDSEPAQEGRKLHAAVVRAAMGRGDWEIGLDHGQRGLVRACTWFLKDLMPNDNARTEYELKIPVNGVAGKPLLERNAILDVLVIDETNAHCIVVDWKFGRKEPNTDAAHDLQLLCYAVAVHSFKPEVKSVSVFRFHPRQYEKRETSVTYSQDWEAHEDTIRAIAEMSTPDAPLVPGSPQCEDCRAKPICPAFNQQTRDLERAIPKSLPPDLTPADMARLLEWVEPLKAAGKMLDQVTTLARAAVEQGVVIRNREGHLLTLKDGKIRRKIADPAAARKNLAAILDDETLNQISSICVGAGEIAYRKASGLKGKGAKEGFERCLGSALARVPDQKKLVWTKEETP